MEKLYAEIKFNLSQGLIFRNGQFDAIVYMTRKAHRKAYFVPKSSVTRTFLAQMFFGISV